MPAGTAVVVIGQLVDTGTSAASLARGTRTWQRRAVAGAEATAISGATNGRSRRATTTGVAQPLTMRRIADTLARSRGIRAKDGIAEVGTGTVAGKSKTRK